MTRATSTAAGDRRRLRRRRRRPGRGRPRRPAPRGGPRRAPPGRGPGVEGRPAVRRRRLRPRPRQAARLRRPRRLQRRRPRRRAGRRDARRPDRRRRSPSWPSARSGSSGSPCPARAPATSPTRSTQALAEHPDVALIMIGANDVTSRTRPAGVGRAPRRGGPPADRGRLRGRRRHLPRPRHHPADRASRCGSWPAGGAGSWPPRRPSPWSSAGGRTVSLGSVLGPAFATDRTMFSIDEFHPSAAGYAQAAAVLLPSVADALGVWPAAADRGRAADPPRHRAAGRPGRGPGGQPHRHRGAAGRGGRLGHRPLGSVGTAAPAPSAGDPHTRAGRGVGGRIHGRIGRGPGRGLSRGRLWDGRVAGVTAE